MAAPATATRSLNRARYAEELRELRRLAKAELEDLSHPELRERECHPDPRIAAGAVEEIARRSKAI